MAKNYRVLKLRSGDSLVAELVENSKTHIKVMRPMDIKYMHFIDALGRKHETMILVDWLKSTTSNSVKLEKDFILQIFTPSPDVIKSYDMQKKFEDTGKTTPPKGIGMFKSKDTESLSQMLANIEEQFKNVNIDEIMEEVLEQMDEEEEASAEELVEDIIKGKTAERVINDEDNPEFGTSYCDWSPNPEDYLS